MLTFGNGKLWTGYMNLTMRSSKMQSKYLLVSHCYAGFLTIYPLCSKLVKNSPKKEVKKLMAEKN